jgi:polysaccharide deacetylase family protein (PEP-CTERM system associated)
MDSNNTKTCLLTFDVEEWFQVENLRAAIPRDDWAKYPSSVLKNTEQILTLLQKHNLTATFFILGWVAERQPETVRIIARQGHEIACHGYNHDLTMQLSDSELKADISNSKTILEKLSGQKISGYRAPNFSVNDRLINVLKETGFSYDSSLNLFKLNPRHGTITMKYSQKNSILALENGLFEIPISTLQYRSRHFPLGGGAYFRLMPLMLFSRLVKRKLIRDNLYNFYLHPWEFEPDQPRIKKIKLNYRIRHYTNLKKTAVKFEEFISILKDYGCAFATMNQYLSRKQL